MSDSGDEPLRAADTRITSELRNEIRRCFKENDLDNLTLKRVRAAVAKKLNLGDTFFKDDERWASRSKEVVNEEVSLHDKDENDPPVASPVTKKDAKKETKKEPQSVAAKRKSTEAEPQPKKRQKSLSDGVRDSQNGKEKPGKASPRIRRQNVSDDGDASSSALSELSDSDPPPKAKKSKSKSETAKKATAKARDNDDNSSELSDVPDSEPQSKAKQQGDDDANASSSELSVLLDDPPPKKKKRASSDAPAKSKVPKPKPDSTISPQDEEIKRLQGQLVKCGIRKLWGKELKPYDTPKAKIAHLKSMLEDVGMKGRFSEDKARQIKEARELQADIEAITEGERKWGMADEEDDEVEEGTRPRRARVVAKGLEELDQFADEESESD